MEVFIDPGKKGAAVLVNSSGIPVDAITFEGEGRGLKLAPILHFIKMHKPKSAHIEMITARPGQSVIATSTQFFVLGQLEGMLEFCAIPISYISPQSWSTFAKKFCEMPKSAKSKDASRILAESMFDAFLKPFRAPRSKKPHDGICDCLAMLAYSERELLHL